MTPKKEKCGLGAYAPKNPAQECTSCTFLSFEFLHTQKLVRLSWANILFASGFSAVQDVR